MLRLKRFIKFNMSSEVDLICYSLMPNHFHMLIRQKSKYGIIQFMRRLMTSYVMYFNKKNIRVDTLFQGKYKGVIVDRDEYLLNLSRYIHLNPLWINDNIDFNKYSSYQYFLENAHPSFVKPEIITDYFSNSMYYKSLSYKNFVDDYTNDQLGRIENVLIDYDV